MSCVTYVPDEVHAFRGKDSLLTFEDLQYQHEKLDLHVCCVCVCMRACMCACAGIQCFHMCHKLKVSDDILMESFSVEKNK